MFPGFAKIIEQRIQEAQKRGDIRKDLKPEFIMYFLNKMMELIQDEHLESLYPNPQDLIMELTNFFFYGIMPRDAGNSPETESTE